MKKLLLSLAFTGLLAVPAVAEVHVNVNLGIPAPVPVIVVEPPLFLVPPSLGFEVAVGIDADLFHIDSRYYNCRDGIWYIGSRFNGPWTVVGHDRLPRGLRKHRLERVHAFRDEEYRHYRRDEKGYRGRAFRPEHERDKEHGKEHGKDKGNGKNGKGNGKHSNENGKHGNGNGKHGND